MTPQRWARLQTLFGDAVSLSESDRALAVQRLRIEDAELADALEQLLQNEARGNSYLDAEVPARVLLDHEVIADRFEIGRFLGAGGMGEVYVAGDRELGASVALKLLPRHFSTRTEMITRFRNEVHAARSVTHPNVCRMFDLGKFTREGLTTYFLTMEFIEGQSLAERLRQGPLPVEEAKSLTLEILDGLGAVHRAGVLHRDLKPANIMLRSKPLPAGERVVIMDFGLARSLGAADPSKLTGHSIIGTPLYMAPEQIESGVASVQTDIYSMGLVVYEMFAGSSGSSESPLAAIVRRSRSAPQSLSKSVPQVGPRWDAALLRCLDPEPSRRPAGTDELRALLDPQKSGSRVPFSWKFSRRQVMGGILASGMGGMVLGVESWMRLRPALKPGEKVMVAPFENLTADPSFGGLGLALTAHLAQSNRFTLVEPKLFPDALRLMLKNPADSLSAADVRHLALRVQVPLVLYTTLSRVGSSYSLQFLAERVSPGSAFAATSWSKSFFADSPRSVFSALNEASEWLRQLAGEAAASIALNSKRPEEVTTDSWEALHDFSQGQIEAAADRRETALVYFESAIRRDPLFVMAHSRRGDILFNLGRDEESLRAWTDAIGALNRRPCSRREELATRAMFASDTGDFEGSVRYYEELAKLYPSDLRPWRYRMMQLGALNRRKAAQAVAEHYVAMLPDSWTSWFQLVNAATLAGDFAAAQRAIGKMNELAPEPQTHDVEFRLYFQQSKYELAEEALRAALESARRSGVEGRTSEFVRRLAHYLADRGRLDEAIGLLHSGVEQDERDGIRSGQAQKLVSIAYLELGHHLQRSIRESCTQALQLDPSVERYRRCGPLLARAGFPDEAASLATRLEPFPQTRLVKAAIHLIRGEADLARDRPEAAAENFTIADDYLPPLWAREHWLHYGALRRDRALVQKAAGQIIECKGSYWWWVEMDWPGLYAQAVRAATGVSRSAQSETALLFS
jgi:eukaryotic-like serine/threonine-protein kinase